MLWPTALGKLRQAVHEFKVSLHTVHLEFLTSLKRAAQLVNCLLYKYRAEFNP